MKNMDIVLSVLQPLVANGIISRDELEQVKTLSHKDVSIKVKLDSYKTIKETCEILHIDRKTLYNWIAEGKLTYSRLSNKKVLVYESSIVQLIEKNKNRAPCRKAKVRAAQDSMRSHETPTSHRRSGSAIAKFKKRAKEMNDQSETRPSTRTVKFKRRSGRR